MPEQSQNLLKKPTTVLICINRRLRTDLASCASRGSNQLADAIEKGLRDRDIPITLERSICLGQCQKGPTIRLVPGGKFVLGLKVEEVENFLDDLEKTYSQTD